MIIGAALIGPAEFPRSGTTSRVVFMPLRAG
jgi:hypothetical protein